MLCVSIGRSRHKRMIAEHKFLVDEGVELVEMRLDYIGRAINLRRLITDRPGPVLITARRREDGGRWMRSEQERLTVLRSAIAAGVEYVDIEADIAAQIPRYGNTKRVISYHDFSGTPENLEELHAAMAEEDADIVKIATMANSFDDNIRMLNLVKQSKVPTIGICMGEIGMVTRILASRVGSPFTFATFSSGKKMAPGQLDWKEMNELYNFDQINDQTELFGVVADPVAHSHSPLIHNAAFRDAKLNACYLPFRVPASDLPCFMDHCADIGVRGISITIPHKEHAMDYCTQAESSANGIGAINTMVFHGDDRLGYNTDYRAAMDCIEQTYELTKDAERPMQGITALVMGAGGVARAIAWGLRQRHAEVTICSRTHERAQMLAAELGCRTMEWEDRYSQKFRLLINCTPVGMHPDMDESPYSASKLNEYMVVFDTVYNPENTLLIKNAKLANCRIITGVDMFVRQAAYQYKLFTGKDAPSLLMRKTIKEATNPVRVR
ncbi:MAG: shikimate dehydrogenase [Pirellulaceae bacterium]|nr:shikimate dehydrogenase [Pirellulaceae bacterium]